MQDEEREERISRFEQKMWLMELQEMISRMEEEHMERILKLKERQSTNKEDDKKD